MTPQREGATTQEEIPHVIRLASESESERKFIVETTAKVLQPPNVPWRAWEEIGKGLAARAMKNGSSYVVDAGRVVLGFAIINHGVVEMLYVKREFRGEGFGRELLAHAGVEPPIPVRATTASFRAWCRASNQRWREVARNEAGTLSHLGEGEE